MEGATASIPRRFSHPDNDSCVCCGCRSRSYHGTAAPAAAAPAAPPPAPGASADSAAALAACGNCCFGFCKKYIFGTK
ncbi:hypothetical protein JYU34_009646 [Plutella xylostella]|uniref:Uncharacterized protein n=1 Tax=Plutella xylostella TaxID=51655 RepID=A0ABQ7QK19_PLUXY|nr:hypothetical protein JYU34_009646 [Plutella xylostella]